jgi:putative proteasome-type protease
VYERPNDRFMVMLSAGNLSISQSVRELLQVEKIDNGPHQPPLTIWNAPSMFDATRVLGATVRRVYAEDGASLKNAGVEFNTSMIFGGQIHGEAMRLFQVYSAGNFIEATRETCYFQIGESKYGKPVLDRLITPTTPLETAAKCALVSMDSTLKSNLGVGLPLDLLVYREGEFGSNRIVCIDERNPYFQMVRSTWGQRLREVFDGLEDPRWDGGETQHPLRVASDRYEPMRKITQPGEKIV